MNIQFNAEYLEAGNIQARKVKVKITDITIEELKSLCYDKQDEMTTALSDEDVAVYAYLNGIIADNTQEEEA